VSHCAPTVEYSVEWHDWVLLVAVSSSVKWLQSINMFFVHYLGAVCIHYQPHHGSVYDAYCKCFQYFSDNLCWRFHLGKVLRVFWSVSSGPGPSLWVRVRVKPEPLPNWWSGSSLNRNSQQGYSSMVNSKSVRIGQVVSGSPSRSIYCFI